MHREYLLGLLENYIPSDESETSSKGKIVEFVKRNRNCFDRSLEEGHITASAWLLSKDENGALLMHHRKLDGWFQLGGHCDGDSDVLAVAIKEAQEESGILDIVPVSREIFDVDVHLIPDNPKDKAHYHYDIRFLLKVNSDEAFKRNEESKELRWVMKNGEMPSKEPSVIRMFEKWSDNILT